MFDVFYIGVKPNVLPHERPADSVEHARKLSRTRYCWLINYLVDLSNWDFLWEPQPWQENFLHIWPSEVEGYAGVQLVPTNIENPQHHYHTTVVPSRLRPENYQTLLNCDFDYRWLPSPWDPPYIYVFGNQHWPAEIQPTVKYHSPGATEQKYMEWPLATLQPCRDNWEISNYIDRQQWDWSWRPDPGDPPYIYEFATQHQKTGGPRYIVPYATEIKYLDVLIATRLPDPANSCWRVLIPISDFDYSWHPDNTEQPYIYVFGNQWNAAEIEPTIEYHAPGATERKYIDHIQATVSPIMDLWQVNRPVDSFDYSWRPDPGSPPYIYVFGNQWYAAEIDPTVEYHVPGATERKYMSDIVATVAAEPEKFVCHYDVAEFDFSWHPDPGDPPYIYVFGNQWYAAEIMPTIEYHVPGATERKYMAHPRARLAERHDNHWHTLEDCDWDYSWYPDPGDPPYIYVFGNQWWPAEKWPTVTYTVSGATEHKYMDNPRARLLPADTASWKPMVPNKFDFDYSWQPDPGDPPYRYVFGNQWWSAEVMPTLSWQHPDATEDSAVKYVDWPRATLLPCADHWVIPPGLDTKSLDLSWVPDPGAPPYIYQFPTQWQRTGGAQYHVPGATEIAYVSEPHAIKISIDGNWKVPAGVDTSAFDWTWHPDATEPPYIYQFATQHQKTGGPVYTVPGATETKYLENIQVKVETTTVPIVEIDHLDGNAGRIPKAIKRMRYFDNYRDTLIRLAKNLLGQYEFVWVCSSVCDYTDFDFTWHPEKWQQTMLHVFASGKEKFGDTFYMHVPTFAERAEKKALLEWYSVNFVPRKSVPRRPLPRIQHNDDSHVNQVLSQTWDGPAALFSTVDKSFEEPVINLWREETKTIIPIGTGAGAVVVPRVALPHIKTQLYDYAYIDKKSHRWQKVDHALDIVFISNGEPCADKHFEYLNSVTYKLYNRLHRVDGVKGRVAAYHAAAEVSKTPWFFAVFAKLEIDEDFDWSWQPDRMQQPKHYIFHALNPVNGLVYGHQAMIAYNRALTLANTGHGLDFTLDSAHEVVPVMSGVARYADTPWMAWRTAFREVIKLKHSLPDVESEFRLSQWLTNGWTEHGQWSVLGAEDAVEYYDSVGGDFAELRKSYDWEWLASYAFVKRGLTADQ